MAASEMKTMAVACPQCGAQFDVGVELAGRPGRCSKCGQVFVLPNVPATIPAAAPPTAAVSAKRSSRRVGEASGPRPPAKEQPPRYIGVSCRVCQTLMYGQPDQVGKSLKCPDCGALTVVPPPVPAKPKKQPAALEGEQYEIWGVDEAPPVAELIAAQPKYIAVQCRMCQTLMYATEDEVGQRLKCHDCGTENEVPRPALVPRHDVLATAGDLALDPTSAPGERPPVLVPPRRKLLFEDERDAELSRQAERAARGDTRGPRYDAHGRPILPRWPLLTGVWRMLVTQEVIARWILLSIVLGFSGQFLDEALLTPLQGQAEAIKMIFAVIGISLAAGWLAMAGPLIVAVVGESADGNDKVHQPPQLMAFDWFRELFSVVMAGAVAGICGLGAWHFVQLAPLGPVVSAAIVSVVVLTVLPVALLSTLLEGTPLGVLSPRLLSSFGRCAGPWLLFYVQTFALAALVGAAAWILARALPPGAGGTTTFVWCLGPLAIAALLVDMRLLGRLAWWISDLMPEEVEQS